MVTDADHMRRALFHARRGEGVTTPNPMVGAVVVTPEGIVAGYGRHRGQGRTGGFAPTLRRACEGHTLCAARACCHVGRTAPSRAHLAAAFAGRAASAIRILGERQWLLELRAGGIAVDVGLLETRRRV